MLDFIQILRVKYVGVTQNFVFLCPKLGSIMGYFCMYHYILGSDGKQNTA